MPLTYSEVAEAITILRKIMPTQAEADRLIELATKFKREIA